MGKTTKSPGATVPTRAVTEAPPITGLRHVGPGYLAVLGRRDHSAISMTGKGPAVYAQAVTSGWYVPTDAPIQDRGLPAPPNPPPAPPAKEASDAV